VDYKITLHNRSNFNESSVFGSGKKPVSYKCIVLLLFIFEWFGRFWTKPLLYRSNRVISLEFTH
ncbi:hypothetical protein, partial [Pseudomonas helleri]|uniref:hypothetical protein n=1 Tax=Pseudomonas helleri TaxID=1608996 RepID=UPI003FD42893